MVFRLALVDVTGFFKKFYPVLISLPQLRSLYWGVGLRCGAIATSRELFASRVDDASEAVCVSQVTPEYGR